MDDEQATKDDFELFGFKPLPHFTVGNILTLGLSRGRYLSVMCIGQGNESIWLGNKDEDKDGGITDLICIHNRDYDGFITFGRLKELVGFFEVLK